MHEQIRYNVVMEEARELVQRLGVPEGEDSAEYLSKIAFAMLEAVYKAEGELAEYACQFLCPRCFKVYRVNVSLRGREVTCVECGHRWRAPDAVEPN